MKRYRTTVRATACRRWANRPRSSRQIRKWAKAP